MIRDINRKKVTKNAWRLTSSRNKTCLRIRVPGGHLDARHLDLMKHIAQQFGNGTVHLTTRQGFEIPGIDFNAMAQINELISEYIKETEQKIGVQIPTPREGYPSAGTRNISACIGNRVCPFANYDTTSMALEIEKTVYPNDFHVKLALTGCPNDCIKAHMQDIGIIGQALPELESQACIGCEACVKNCRKKVTNALTVVDHKVERDNRRCIGCGECVLVCPTQAWSRNPVKYFRLVIMGRTGKKNPRLAAPFAEWLTQDEVIAILKNLYPYIDRHIDRSLVKEHVGYIADRTGYKELRNWLLKGIKLNPRARIAKTMQWSGYEYGYDTDRWDCSQTIAESTGE
ncbi:sulfite reductase subunit C [Chitinispirillales bacterium ANBcel5]|uniref:sulfite reductase subunit C n=1 Tax=Cellulosispirillum alkaliphilum TaxID=3039283 RepID=UPI002A570FBD|nr:sulfite reductase subunit C [Chitinispirillales bacterium ANBcel5]